MEYKLIYVFSEDIFNKLLELGYTPLKIDGQNSLYVFSNNSDIKLSIQEGDYILSNTLTL